MSDTPRTDAVIAAADATPECRVTFLIKQLANLAKDLERELYQEQRTYNVIARQFNELMDAKEAIREERDALRLSAIALKDKP